jgi:hypothetical protein
LGTREKALRLNLESPAYGSFAEIGAGQTWDPVSGGIVTVDNAHLPRPGNHIRDFLLEVGRVEPLAGYEPKYLSIHTPDVLARLQRGDPSWEVMVLPAVAETIKQHQLLGYRQPS